MRLKLNSVHLVNFRKHEDYLFTPADNGITAIIGENGKGKSSIIDGIAWALYGVKPSKSLKNSELKRNTSNPSDPCYVEVSLSLDANTVLTVRRSLKGKAATVQCECFINGKQEAGPSVANADKWIPKTIGLDADGFLSAVLVQQKQVDDIISQTAAVRQANIEKLTGITAATRALKAARDEANALKKAIDLIAPDVNDKEKYKELITATESDIKKLEEQRAALKDKLKERMSSYADMKANLDTAKKNHEDAQRLKYEIDGLKSNLVILTGQRDAYMEQMESMKQSLPESTDPSSLQHELEEINKSLSTMRTMKARYDGIVENSPTNGDLRKAEKKLADLTDNMPDDDIESLNKSLESLKSSLATSTAARQQAMKSLKTIELIGNNDDKSVKCPTCMQEVDYPGHVIDELHGIIDENDNAISESKKNIEDVTSRINAITDYNASIKTLTDDITGIREGIENGKNAKKKSDDLKPELEATEKQAEGLQARIAAIRNDQLQIRQYKTVTESFTNTVDKIDDANRRIETSKNALDGIEVMPERSMNALESNVGRMSDEIMALKEKAVELKGQSMLLNERLSNANDGLHKAESDEDKRRKALKKHEVAQASVKVLSGFREHLAKESVPSITDYASDLVNEITAGMFASVNIDEKYNITVTDANGMVMDVHALSGGEQSVVAIALRLAISEMLSGGEPSMLILDEVLTAMDDNRSQSILTAIQEAGHGQVIIIAHNDIIRSIADTAVIL